MEKCGTANAELIAYEEPREGNPFETTVYAWEEGEVKCERPEGHKGLHGFCPNKKTYLEFRGKFSKLCNPDLTPQIWTRE